MPEANDDEDGITPTWWENLGVHPFFNVNLQYYLEEGALPLLSYRNRQTNDAFVQIGPHRRRIVEESLWRFEPLYVQHTFASKYSAQFLGITTTYGLYVS